MIRSTKHTLKFCNDIKLSKLHNLIDDYKSLVKDIVNHVWDFGYKNFNIISNNLELPSFIDSTTLKLFSSSLTERIKQCAGKQAMAMISAATEKRRKQLWKLKDLQKSNQPFKYLQRKISLQPLVKPNCSEINVELDSRFVDFEFDNQNEFLCFVRLSSYKTGCSIKIPIKNTPVFDKWNKVGKLKNSIRINKQNIHLFFEVEETSKNKTGEVIGCDQGIKSVITLSDGQTTGLYQNRYDLSHIQNLLSRKQKGSKAFAKAQDFRKNYINWSINQLNFSNIKELRLEKLHQVGFKKSKSRFLSHWTYTLINDKLKRISEEKGFLIKEMPNEFRSQRCSRCGWVRKSNRKGKTFKCSQCSNAMDADYNAASNLEIDLYEIPYWVRQERVNLKGFFWRPDGIFSKGQELIVPDTERE